MFCCAARCTELLLCDMMMSVLWYEQALHDEFAAAAVDTPGTNVLP